MNITRKWKLFMFVLYVVALWSLMPLTQVFAFPNVGGFGGLGGRVLRQVSFTGVFYPPGELERKSGTETLRADFQNGKKLVFDVETARDLTGMRDSWEILNDIWPPTLYFRGPKDLISFLENPQVIGKQVTVEGLIYISDRIFQITEVKVQQ